MIYNRLKATTPLLLTDVEQDQFDKATNCYSCLKKFDGSYNGEKNRDHDHYSGLVLNYIIIQSPHCKNLIFKNLTSHMVWISIFYFTLYYL